MVWDKEHLLKIGGTIKKLGPLEESTKKILQDKAERHSRAFKKGEEWLKNSKEKWGKVPLPGEPGCEKYWTMVN